MVNCLELNEISATKTPRNHESQGHLDLCSSDVVGVASCWTGNFSMWRFFNVENN